MILPEQQAITGMVPGKWGSLFQGRPHECKIILLSVAYFLNLNVQPRLSVEGHILYTFIFLNFKCL